MAVPATQVNYPQTTFDFASADGSVHTIVQPTSVITPLVVPATIRDGAAADGAAGQYLTAGAGSALLWLDLPAPPPTPSLAEVMAVATAGDAGGQTLSNLPAVALLNGGGAVSLSAVNSQAYLNISTPTDDSGTTKEFTRKYAKISFDGTLYYLPLYAAPV
jgi:hypothetical protein